MADRLGDRPRSGSRTGENACIKAREIVVASDSIPSPGPRLLPVPEPPQPAVRHSDQGVALQVVDPLPAPLLNPEQSSIPKDPEMAGDRRPLVVESLGDVARGHLSSLGVDDDEDVASGFVGQRREDQFEGFEFGETVA